MAISILNQSDNVYNDPGLSFSLTHSVDSGADLLLVLVGYENEDFESISGVVWDSAGANESLTEIGSGHSTADDAAVQAFFLTNPTAGASKLITVTMDGALTNAGASIVAFTLDGVNTSSPIRDEDGDAQQDVSSLQATVSVQSGDFLAIHANQEQGGTLDFDSSTFAVTLVQDNVDSGTPPTFHSGYGTADSTSETGEMNSTEVEHAALQLVAIAPAASSSSSSSSQSQVSSSSSSLSSSSSSSSSLSSSSSSSSSISSSSSSSSLSSSSSSSSLSLSSSSSSISSSSCAVTAHFVSNTSYLETGIVSAGSGIVSAGFTHTVVEGKDRLLIVTVGFELSDDNCPGGCETVVSSITFDGIPLTVVSGGTIECGLGCGNLEHWYLVNPPVETADIEVIFSDNMDEEGSFFNAVNFQNVDQDTPIGNVATNSGETITPSASISSSENSQILDTYWVDDYKKDSIGAGQTEIAYMELPISAGVGNASFGASIKDGTGSSTTMEWTLNDPPNEPWLIAAIEINSKETIFVTKVRCCIHGDEKSIFIDYNLDTLEVTRIWQEGTLEDRIIKIILEDGVVKKYTVDYGGLLDEDLSGLGFAVTITDCGIEVPFNIQVRTI